MRHGRSAAKAGGRVEGRKGPIPINRARQYIQQGEAKREQAADPLMQRHAVDPGHARLHPAHRVGKLYVDLPRTGRGETRQEKNVPHRHTTQNIVSQGQGQREGQGNERTSLPNSSSTRCMGSVVRFTAMICHRKNRKSTNTLSLGRATQTGQRQHRPEKKQRQKDRYAESETKND